VDLQDELLLDHFLVHSLLGLDLVCLLASHLKSLGLDGHRRSELSKQVLELMESVLALGVVDEVQSLFVHHVHVAALLEQPAESAFAVLLDGVVQRGLVDLILDVMLRAVGLEHLANFNVVSGDSIEYGILAIGIDIIYI